MVADTDARTTLRTALESGEPDQLRQAALRHPDHPPTRYHAAMSAFAAGDTPCAATDCAAAHALQPGSITYEALVALCAFARSGAANDLERLKKSVTPATDAVRSLALLTIEKKLGELTGSFRGADEIDYHLGGPIGFILDLFDWLAGWIYAFINHALNFLRNLTNATARIANRLVIAGIRIEGNPLKRSVARSLFEKALVIDGDNIYALESLIRIALLERDAEGAKRYLTHYFRLDADAAEQTHGIGWRGDAAFICGDYAAAIPLYERWVAEEPFDYMPCYRLALSHLALGDDAAAHASFAITIARNTPGLIEKRIDRLFALLESS